MAADTRTPVQPVGRAARSRKPDSGHTGIIRITVRGFRASWNAMKPRYERGMGVVPSERVCRKASCAAGVNCRSGVPRQAGWRQPGTATMPHRGGQDRHDVTSWRLRRRHRCRRSAAGGRGRGERGRRGGRVRAEPPPPGPTLAGRQLTPEEPHPRGIHVDQRAARAVGRGIGVTRTGRQHAGTRSKTPGTSKRSENASRYALPRDLGYDISRSQQRTEGHCHGGDRRGRWGVTGPAGSRR